MSLNDSELKDLLENYDFSTFTSLMNACGGRVEHGKDSVFQRNANILTVDIDRNATRAFLETVLEWFFAHQPIWMRNGTLLTVSVGPFELRVVSSTSSTSSTQSSECGDNVEIAISFFLDHLYRMNTQNRVLDFLYTYCSRKIRSPEEAVEMLGANHVAGMLDRLKDMEENGRPWKDAQFYREFLLFRRVFVNF